MQNGFQQFPTFVSTVESVDVGVDYFEGKEVKMPTHYTFLLTNSKDYLTLPYIYIYYKVHYNIHLHGELPIATACRYRVTG